MGRTGAKQQTTTERSVVNDTQSRRLGLLTTLLLLVGAMGSGGCATIRVTDPPRTATEQFLLSGAATRAIDQLSTESTSLRDRRVYVDVTYFANTAAEHTFLLGELRAKLLLDGVRVENEREKAEVILEVRSAGLGVDRLEYLLGIPAIYIPGLNTAAGDVPVATPELAIIKNTRQRGYASVAFIAYWRDTGEVVASSGPFVGKTYREDWWFFGTGPKTIGNIPPAED